MELKTVATSQQTSLLRFFSKDSENVYKLSRCLVSLSCFLNKLTQLEIKMKSDLARAVYRHVGPLAEQV